MFKQISFFKRSPKSKNNDKQNNNYHLDQNSDDTINSISSPSSPNLYNTKEPQIILNNYPPNYMQSSLQTQYSDPNFSQYQRHHKYQKSNTNSNKRRTVSNADFYYENKKRNNKNKKTKRKSSKSSKKRKRKGTQIDDVTNYYYNGVDDNDENDIHNSELQIYNHVKSDTMVIRNVKPTVSVPDYYDDDDQDIGRTQSLPLSPNDWHIHRPITPNSTPNGRLYVIPTHPIHTNNSNNSSSAYSNYSNYSDHSNNSYHQYQHNPQRPKLQLNHSIPLRPEEKQLIIRTNHINEMKAAEEEFQNLIHIIVQQLKYDHDSNHSNIVNLIRNGSYLPSSELKFYISKLKLSTYQLQEKIEMIRDIISIYEKGFVITSECLVNYQQSIPIEISHIIYEYICNDFLIQAPLLRIILCERIKKFYKTEYLRKQIDLLELLMDSANSFDPRHRYYATIDVYIRFAIFWWNKNEFDRACQYVETSLKNCDMRDNRRAKLNYMLAHIYQFHIKKYKLSKKHYQTALKQNQTHGKSLFEYAYLLDKKLNNKQTAKTYYEKHIELIENHSSNIIEYDIDIKSPKLSIFIGDGTSFSHNGSFVFKPSVSGSGFALTDYVEPNNSGRMRTLSQSISISPKGHKHLSVAFASDDEGDLSHSEQLDIDLAGMDDEKKQQSPTQESSISVTSENNVKNGVEIDSNSTNNNNQKEKPVKYSSHANKLKNKSSSNKFGYVNLTLAPINSAASMGSESLKLSTSSRSRSKSYNKKFEDEESGIEIESGLDLHEAMDVEKENKEKKEKALLSLEAIEEENDLDTTIIKNNNKTRTRNGSNGQYLSSDDEDDIVLVGGAYLGAAIDEDDGVDIGGVGGYNTGYTSENEIDNTERTGIGTRSHNSDNSHTSHRSHRYRVKNKKKIAKESRLRLADIYASEGDNDNAKIQYDILLEHDPKNFGAILGYAHFLQYNLKDNESSEFHYQQAIELYTTSNIYLSKNIKVTKGIEMFVKYCDLLITEGKSRKIDVFQIIEKAKESIPIQMHNKLLLEFGAILYEDVDDDNLIYLDKAIECFKFIVDDSNNDTIDITRDRQYHYDAYLELGRIYHHYKNDLTTSYEYFQMALPLNHGKQDWHLHFELSMLMSDDDFIYKNIKRPFAIAKDHAQKSLDFCIDDQDRNELISIYKSLSLIHL